MEAIEKKHTKVTIVGGGLSGIMAATKITHEFLQKYPKDQGYSLEITLVDPQEKLGGNTYNRYDVNVFMAQPLGELGFDDAGSFLKHMNRVVKDAKATDRTPEFWKRIAPQVPFDETPVTNPADGSVVMGPDGNPKAKGFDPKAFVTHNQYGHYVRTHLRSLREWVEKEGYPIKINTSIDPDAPFPDKKVEYLKADVIDAWQEDGKGKVKLSDGSVIESDVVVLATGNVAPRYLNDISGQSLKGKQGYYNLDDAGLAKSNVNEADVTALIGMGNGAHFAVLSAIENGYKGKFILCSGDGTQPEIRDTSLEKEYRRKILTVDKCAAIKTQKNDLPAEEWWKLLEQEIVLARTQGFSRHDVIDSIVPDFNTMWRMMSDEQKGVFRKNHGTDWGQSRYRMPKVHSDAIQKLIDEGRLVYADGLVRDGAKTGISCDEKGGFKLLFEMDKGLKSMTDGIEQTTETIGGKQYKVVHVPKLVNNTGPSSKLQDMSPLIKGLEEKGFIAQHSLGGLRVDDSLHVINAEGNTQNLFYAIGPITAGDFYEAFTIPAIRRCSQILGESIVRDHVLNNAKDFTPEYHPEVNEEGQIGYRKRVSTKSGDGSLPPH